MFPFDQILEAWTVARTKFPPAMSDLALIHAHGADIVDRMDKLARAALDTAVGHLDQGEQGGNNCGPFVERCVAPAKVPQNWCAGFAGLCYLEAAGHLSMALPFQRSLGAKKLGANVAAVGRRFTDPREARPGDLMIFDRGAQGSWMGHVAIVESADLGWPAPTVFTIEGNSGPKVMRRERSAGRDRFAFFASLRRAP